MLDSAIETQNTRIDQLLRVCFRSVKLYSIEIKTKFPFYIYFSTFSNNIFKEKEDMSKELVQVKKDLDKNVSSFKKCLSVNKKLLIEKVTKKWHLCVGNY